jgi:hypothetical protein
MRHHLFPEALRLAAQKKAVIEQLAEYLQQTYMEQETSVAKELICGLLPYEDRVVTQEVLAEVYADLEQLAQEQAQIIRSYQVVKRPVLRGPRETVERDDAAHEADAADAADAVPAGKRTARPKKPASTENAGGLR